MRCSAVCADGLLCLLGVRAQFDAMYCGARRLWRSRGSESRMITILSIEAGRLYLAHTRFFVRVRVCKFIANLVYGSRCKVQGIGYRIQAAGLRVHAARFSVWLQVLLQM